MKKNKYEYEYDCMMKEETKNIKIINDKFTKSDVDLIITGKCSYGAFLWQKEIVSEIKMYITYLGFIDSLIIRELKEMEWNKKFDDNKGYEKHQNKHNYYIEQRHKLIKIIETNTNMVFKVELFKYIINGIPASKNFDLLYKDIQSNEYQENLQLEFINAYNNGFIKEGLIEYKYINERFEKYCNEINEHKNNNKKRLEKLKLNN